MSLAVLRPEFGPTLGRILHLQPDSLRTADSLKAYRSALGRFRRWLANRGEPPLSRAVFRDWRQSLIAEGLAGATVNQYLSLMRLLFEEAGESDLLDHALVLQLCRVSGVPKRGVRTPHWLTTSQAEQLLSAPDPTTLMGLRDRAVLATFMGSGLRRAEMARLRCEHLSSVEGRPVILNLVSKGGRVRTIPLALWADAAITAWRTAAGIVSGPVFVRTHRSGQVIGGAIQSCTVYDIVKRYAAQAGLETSPHDLRRSFARLAKKGGADWLQLSLTLGHASIETTRRYVGDEQTFQNAPADFVQLTF